MSLHRFPRVRRKLALCMVFFITLGLAAEASAQTPPRIIAATTLPSFSWQPHSAIDAQGNIYVTGLTAEPTGNFVTVTKIDPTLQTVLYSKVLSSGWSSPIVIDSAGYASVGVHKTIYKLDPAGTVVQQTNVNAVVMDLALGPLGVVHVAAVENCEFPDPECSATAVVGRVNANGVFDGLGFGGAGTDQPQSIAVGSDGHIVLAGFTFSPDFPITANALMNTANPDGNPDGFVAILAPDFNIVYASYLNGQYGGQAWATGVGRNGESYVAFEADQSPALPPGGGNVVIKFDAAANIQFMRRISGMVLDIAEDGDGHLILTGHGSNFQTGAQTRVVGTPTSEDAVVIKLAADGASYDAIVYLGSGQVYGRSLSLDSNGTAVIAGDVYLYYDGVVAQATPLTNPPAYNTFGEMIFISKVDLTIPAGNTPVGANVTVTSSDPTSSVTFSSVNGPGTTTMEPVNAASLNLTLPGTFMLSTASMAYEIQTTAAVGGPITVCLNGSALTPAELETAVILHGVSGHWIAEPTTHVGGGRLCATVNSLSPFAVGVRVDRSAPTISISSPTSRAYLLNEVAAVTFTCADDGTVATCAANPAGSVLNTASVGQRTVTVTATDTAGNTSSATVTYTVSYGVATGAARVFKSGSTARVVVQLTDARGTNVSSPGIALTNLTVDGQPTSEQFTYSADLDGYALNLKTSGFAAGAHTLAFTAGDDPQTHPLFITVR
jgi:hypothetical protein